MQRPTFLVQRAALDRLRQRLVDEPSQLPALLELCACHRINALGAIFAAGRGWPGATFSCAEVLTALYHVVARVGPTPRRRDVIVLGKGHAAPMQYACLAGVGLLPVGALLRYTQSDGPQAHTDRATPGIDANTGSLGQALSKCCGLALASPHRRVFALLGDGELQEGQCFEAFATMHHRNLHNLTVIIDRNGIQTDSMVSDIKRIADLDGILRGFGLRVLTISGNDMEAVLTCLSDPTSKDRPTVVIADTAKGRGVSFMAARSCARRGYRWHGGAPSLPEYLDALTELGQGVTDVETSEALRGFVERQRLVEAAPAIAPAGGLSTGAAFAAALRPLMTKHRDLVVLDADLEHACRLTEVAKRFPKRFVEMGISEADMVSCAGGLALGGKLPVVNTYAAFFRRAYEQIYVNATEETRIIYAGHYAGLCYATDGKTHQCTGDVAMMRAIPGMTVLYPAFPEEISGMLEWYLDSDHQGPLYLRLHRTPAAEVKLAEPARFVPGWGVTIRSRESPTVILTSGPHMVAACTDVADETGIDLIAISTLRGLSAERVSELIERYDELLIIEELIEAGGLLDELSRVIASLCSSRRPAMRHLAVDGFTCSTLEPDGLYRRFGLDREALSHWVRAGFGV